MRRYPTLKFTHFEGLDILWKQLFLLVPHSAVERWNDMFMNLTCSCPVLLYSCKEDDPVCVTCKMTLPAQPCLPEHTLQMFIISPNTGVILALGVALLNYPIRTTLVSHIFVFLAHLLHPSFYPQAKSVTTTRSRLHPRPPAYHLLSPIS